MQSWLRSMRLVMLMNLMPVRKRLIVEQKQIMCNTINMALVRGESWKDISKTQLEYLNDQTHHKRGLLLSIGGGEFVKKILTAAINGVESRTI